MKRIVFVAVMAAMLWMAVIPRPARADEPVVRAVLFYSPTCPHCHQALNEVIRPLVEQYGQQLLILGLDVTQTEAQAWFQLAAQRYGLEQLLVPTLIVADVVLVGTAEIKEQFPGLVEAHLAQGGVDWPDIPGLREALGTPTPAMQAVASATSAATVSLVHTPGAAGAGVTAMAATTAVPKTATPLSSATPRPTGAAGLVGPLPTVAHGGVVAKLARDPLGHALALVVLALMLYVVGRVVVAIAGRRTDALPQRAWHGWLLPVISALGLLVAGYLAYVETAQVEAACGPVGDCNLVQQSAYARLFGVLPIGVLGLVGYAAILFAWIVATYSRGRRVWYAQAGMFMMALVGTLFSIYLTFLEPFVIGATCAWCLTSAVLITALLWLTVAPGIAALTRYWPLRALGEG